MNSPSIAWEKFEAKRGRPFPREQKCFLDVIGLVTEAMRTLVTLRERYLLVHLEGNDPERLQELGKLIVEATNEVREMQAYEWGVYGNFLRG